MLDAGLSVSLSTDNRLMSGVSLSGELRALQCALDIPADTLRHLQRSAAAASFMPEANRSAALAVIDGAR
jgi:adenosine deaminase